MIASVTERARAVSPLDPAFTSETRRSLRAMSVPDCSTSSRSKASPRGKTSQFTAG